MKRFLCIILAALMLAAFAGCSNKKNEEQELPKFANDPEVLAKWDEYEILNNIPRYTGSGLFDNIYVGEAGMTVVSFLGVSAEDFEAYAKNMSAYGFKLDEGSSIWVTEGITGVPIFKKGSTELTLVWNMNGSLDIGVKQTAS